MEKDLFLYRSYLCQRKFAIVRDEINDGSSPRLQPLRTLANYLAAPASRRQTKRFSVLTAVKSVTF